MFRLDYSAIRAGYTNPFLDPLHVFQLYTAMKAFFRKGGSDAIWEAGFHLRNQGMQQFERRNDELLFGVLAKKLEYKRRKVAAFLISNFTKNLSWHPTDLESGLTIYDDWVRRWNSLELVFHSDIEFLAEECQERGVSFLETLRAQSASDHPLFLQWALGGQVSAETATILFRGFGCPGHKSQDIVLKPLLLQMTAYSAFVPWEEFLRRNGWVVREMLSRTDRNG